ncbi:hypothetical protein RRG08_003495 [Elysia crispata]|uniref:Uncharacterized protein n=1 Tax=Elysia crispata TaxID=231223 RepID=A0AAE1CTK1_9GAST|nr:hypothetical protein RRG08_003495 [Elysia crispata]
MSTAPVKNHAGPVVVITVLCSLPSEGNSVRVTTTVRCEGQLWSSHRTCTLNLRGGGTRPRRFKLKPSPMPGCGTNSMPHVLKYVNLRKCWRKIDEVNDKVLPQQDDDSIQVQQGTRLWSPCWSVALSLTGGEGGPNLVSMTTYKLWSLWSVSHVPRLRPIDLSSSA